MDFEKILREQRAEQDSRDAGVLKIKRFLERVLPDLRLDDPQTFLSELESMSPDDLLDVLKRINGILTETPISERDSFASESVVQNQFMFVSANELVPPSIEVRKRLLSETLTALQNLIRGETPENFEEPEERERTDEVVARTLFNMIIYLHPFGDGNGRTARTIYTLLSPEIKDKSLELLAPKLTERPKKLKDYHSLLNQSVFEMMLNEHQINWAITDKPYLPVFDIDNPTGGLDANQLMFIAAYDAMDEDERSRYIKNESGHLVIKQDDLTPELKAKLDVNINTIREEFVDSILELSVYPEKWPDWLRKSFLEATTG